MDPAYLLDLTGGDRTVVREILNDFLASDAGDRLNLAAAVEARDAVLIAHQAHRIKGAARAIGATEYAEAAAAVEHLAPTGGDITSAVSELERTAAELAASVAGFD